jgi:hypothetical protein
MIKPMPTEATESNYTAVLQALGLEPLPTEERIKGLLNVPPQELLAKVSPALPLGLLEDSDIVPGPLSFEALSSGQFSPLFPGSTWCEDLLIGDCQLDVRLRRSNLQLKYLRVPTYVPPG